MDKVYNTEADIANVADIEDAILKKHTQNTDQYLDEGGTNQVAVTDAKDAVDKKHTQGSDTTLGTMTADVNMDSHKLTSLSVPASNGDSIRATAKITEALLESATDLKHTQNTDTGTTSTTFQIDSGNTGPKVKNDSGVVEIRNAADNAYADEKVKDLTVDGLTASLPVFTNASKKLETKSAVDAFAAIKQAATTSATGVVELATNAEAIAMTDTTKALTPSNLPSVLQTFAYGVRWDTSATSPTCTKGIVVNGVFIAVDYTTYPIQEKMRRCIMDNTRAVQYYLHPENSALKTDGGTANLDGSDGQVVVEVPKFEYLITEDGDYKYLLVSENSFYLTLSDTSKEYSRVHEWFNEGGDLAEYKYFSAFEGVLKQIASAEIMPNQVDRDFSGASAWANVDINAYDDTGDLTITASAADQYCTLVEASAPTVVGRKYTMQFDVANLVGTWTIKDFDGVQTIGQITSDGASQTIDFTAVATGGGFRLVADADTSSMDFDNVSLKRWAGYIDGTGDQTGTAGDLIHSVYGYIPLTYFTRIERRTYSVDGIFHQLGYWANEAIILLMLTEYGSWNSQSWLPGYTEGTPWDFSKVCKTGITAQLGNVSGSISWADAPSGLRCSYDWSGTPSIILANSYRGIENIFGHLWKWVDGINIQFIGNLLTDVDVYVCNDPDNWAEDTSTNYTDLGIDLPLVNGYQKTLHNGCLLPSAGGGDSATYICDPYYASAAAGWRALLSAGNLTAGAGAGFACRNSSDDGSNRNPSIAGRLCS